MSDLIIEAAKAVRYILDTDTPDHDNRKLEVRIAQAVLDLALKQESAEKPVAYINVENRTLEWNGPVEWLTPTTIKLMKIPLYTLSKQESAEPVAWRTFDGEGGYDFRSYEDNENYKEWYATYNPKYPHWCEPLYTTPTAAIEDFRRRAVEVCSNGYRRGLGEKYQGDVFAEAISRLPLIGE